MKILPKIRSRARVIGNFPTLIIYMVLFINVPCSSSEHTISLQDAIETSLKYNFDIRIARNQDRINQNNKILGVGEFLPKVDAVAGIRESGGSNQDNWEAGVEANWTVFDGLYMIYNKNAYQEKAQLSNFEYRQKIEILTVDVFQAYFNSVTQSFLLTTAEDQVKISSERLEKINFKKSLGTSSTSEQLNARVALNEDRSQVQNRKLQKLIALNSLKLLMGRSVKDTLAVEQEFKLPPLKNDLDGWLEKAIKQNTTLSIQQKVKKIEAINLSMAKSFYWPKVVVSGSAGYLSDNFSDAKSTYSIGASVRFSLLAGFKNITAHKNSLLNNKNKNLALEEYIKLLESLVHQQWAVLQNAYQQVLFEQDAVELAKENLNISQQQLNLGNIEGVAFREAQLSLVKALTGFLYTTDIGPDDVDSTSYGPPGYEEINQIKDAGNYGWPAFVGPDLAYIIPGTTDWQNPESPVNVSKNNTGSINLPPTRAPFISYFNRHGCTPGFDIIGCMNGGSAMMGPVYRYDASVVSPGKLPGQLDGHAFFWEFIRKKIYAFPIAGDGNYDAIFEFLPALDFTGAIDMEIGPDHHLYILTHGNNGFSGAGPAGVYRIDYTGIDIPAAIHKKSHPPSSKSKIFYLKRGAWKSPVFQHPEKGLVYANGSRVIYPDPRNP